LPFRTLLKELFHMPFAACSYISDSFERYSQKGGVADIHTWKPCVVIRVLIKHFGEHLSQTFRKLIHQYLAAFSVNYWECDTINKISTMNKAFRYNCSFSSKERRCDWRTTEASPEVSPFKLSMGAVFIGLLDDFEKLKKKYGVEKSWRFVMWDDLFEQALDFKLMSGQDHYAEDGDIFSQSSSPPYSMEDATVEIKQMRLELYGGESLPVESYDWGSSITDATAWSSYWHSGLEWWGCYCISSLNREEMTYIIGSASTSD